MHFHAAALYFCLSDEIILINERRTETMKKLLSVLMTLCLLCVAVAALAEETSVWDSMPNVVTATEDLELTDADFAGEWVADKVFIDTVYLTPEEVEVYELTIRKIRIGDGQIVNIIPTDEGDQEAPAEYTIENNQLLFTDGQGIEAVVEKLEDGNIVMNVFLPQEDETVISVTIFFVKSEA